VIKNTAQSQTDKDREAILVAKYNNKTITPAERAELAELLEVAV